MKEIILAKDQKPCVILAHKNLNSARFKLIEGELSKCSVQVFPASDDKEVYRLCQQQAVIVIFFEEFFVKESLSFLEGLNKAYPIIDLVFIVSKLGRSLTLQAVAKGASLVLEGPLSPIQYEMHLKELMQKFIFKRSNQVVISPQKNKEISVNTIMNTQKPIPMEHLFSQVFGGENWEAKMEQLQGKLKSYNLARGGYSGLKDLGLELISEIKSQSNALSVEFISKNPISGQYEWIFGSDKKEIFHAKLNQKMKENIHRAFNYAEVVRQDIYGLFPLHSWPQFDVVGVFLIHFKEKNQLSHEDLNKYKEWTKGLASSYRTIGYFKRFYKERFLG